MKNWIEKARTLRPIIEKAAKELPDEDAIEASELFPEWKPGVDYIAGERVRYDGTLYFCLQSHRSQSDWMPGVAVSLWGEVLIPDPTVIPEWEQPDSTNPYAKGDIVRHNGKTWESDVDNNVWEPGVYGWHEVIQE